MCGIAGVVAANHLIADLERIGRASNIQKHRGPDHQAFRHYIGKQEVVFVHQRLSIIDLSEAANQPFEDDQFALIFNGEIYNYVELKTQLLREGVVFRTNSDTEVLFQALKVWGVAKTLPRCNGMWAFAWLEKGKNSVVLARDRFGVKPLYYHFAEGRLCFASEIKTVLEISQAKVTLQRMIAGLYLRQAVLESTPDQTFFNEISKVPPGTYAQAQLSRPDSPIEMHRYFNLEIDNDLSGLPFEDACSQLRTRLMSAVEIRLRSDVPVGVLLSGGLDSSILAALAIQLNKKPVEFLSYTSGDPRYDESTFSKRVGKHLGRSPHLVAIDFDSRNPVEDLEQLAWQNDQPLHSFAAYAHYLMMARAKELGIVVLLSGQGADEGYCGYRKYWPFYFQELKRSKRYGTLLSDLAAIVQAPDLYSQISFSEVQRYLPAWLWRSSQPLMTINANAVVSLKPGESIQERQIRDFVALSVPSLLHYEDRMSMAFSREIRLPFLDYRVAELGVSILPEFKLKRGWTKYLLRKSFEKDLPEAVVWRRDKKGFSNPQSEWIRSKLSKEILSRFTGEALVYRHDLVDKSQFLALYNRVLRREAFADDRLVFRVFAMELFLGAYSNYIQYQ